MNRFILKRSLITAVLYLCCSCLLAAAPGEPAKPEACTISASAFATGTLSCTNTSVLLRGNSPTAGITYSWTGPNGFTSSLQSPTVTAPGVYSLVATSPAGCTGTASVTIVQNIAPPANVVATTVSGSTILNCIDTTQTLTGSSSTSGAGFTWTGANGFYSASASASITTAGIYTLTVTNPANGCSATASINITANLLRSGGAASSRNMLTCYSAFTLLDAIGTVPHPAYQWRLPNGIVIDSQTVHCTIPGQCIVTITNLDNGCASQIPVTVRQDTLRPDVSIINPGPITCSQYPDTLTGVTSAPNGDITWDGPNFYPLNSTQIIVYEPGVYTAYAFNPTNACTSQGTTTTVTENIVEPTLTATLSGSVSCATPIVVLSGSSDVSNASFIWYGPNSLEIDSAIIHSGTPGAYTLIALYPNDANVACFAMADVYVNGAICSGARQAASLLSPSATGDNLPRGFILKAWPNPYREKTRVTFQLPTAGMVSIQVYNSAGILEKTLFNAKAVPGQSYQLSLQGLPAGVHVVVMRVDNKNYTRKIISL